MNLDDIRKLHQKKHRDAEGRYLIEGEHLVLELQKAAANDPRLLSSELYVSHEYERWQSPFKTHRINSRQMAQITETKAPQGIAAVVPLLPAPAPAADESVRSIYLYEIQDPGNLGTILRTMAWFGRFRCLLSPGSVDPHNSKVVRASMGAIFHVPVEIDVALNSLRPRFEQIACLDLDGESLNSPAFGQFDCYLFGNEARGLPASQLADLAARSFTIAGSRRIDSLNLAATVNMVLYELNR